MLVLGVLVRLDSRGPALFKQKRLGLNRKAFDFYKFRSMHVDSRERFPEYFEFDYRDDELAEVRLEEEDDPRLTRVGRWKRRTSLDELPNFWHVVTGEMSLVGPRPELPEMLPYYRGEQLEKFSVPPGITGLAQVCGRGRLKFLETVEYDLEYVNNRSLKGDLAILLKTVKPMVFRDGAF